MNKIELRPLHDPTPQSFVEQSRQHIEHWQSYWKKVKNDPDFETKMMPDFSGRFNPATEAT